MQTVKKYISIFLVRLGKRFGGEEVQEVALCQPEPQKEDKEEKKKVVQLIKRETEKKKSTEITEYDPRDMMELMEVPFLSLSKNRTKPIIYQSKDGKVKVKVTANREHYLASIYDWDIVLFVAAKMQEILNEGSDIPPRTLVVPRSEILKSLGKHNGKTNRKEIEESFSRLQLTGIETTIHNEDYRYRSGFGFLDSWGYTERKDVKEFRITLSDWLYDGICRKGALLKVSQEYFNLTSGLKKFLYRTARKHVGNGEYWEFSIEKLYEKSGSEQGMRFFRRDLKKAVSDNDIPDYTLEWREEKDKVIVRFINKNINPKTIEAKISKTQVQKAVSALKFPKNLIQ